MILLRVVQQVFWCFVAQFHILFNFFIGFHLCIGCQKTWMIHEIKCKAPKYLLYKKLIRLYENFSPIMNSLHGCLQKQLMIEHDVSDVGPCYVAQKDGPNYSKQAFFGFFCSPAAMQCWEPIWKFLRCSGRLKQQLRSQPYLTKFYTCEVLNMAQKFEKKNEIGGNNRF